MRISRIRILLTTQSISSKITFQKFRLREWKPQLTFRRVNVVSSQMPKKSKTHTRHEQFEGGEKLNFGQIVRKMSTLKKKSKHYKAKDL